MTTVNRVFWLVLDGFGIGEASDAKDYGDENSNTLKSILQSGILSIPNLTSLGLFNIHDIAGKENAVTNPRACFARISSMSQGKDTITGHWEMAGIITEKAFPLFPNGFPEDLMASLSRSTGKKLLCNQPYSGTQVLHDYGELHLATGALIIYTSADSVCQIAAHEDYLPPSELYRICEIARDLFSGKYGVARIIARPFEGSFPHFKRTANRRDFSLVPPGETVLDKVSEAGFEVIGVGKIHDIFAGRGLTQSYLSKGNASCMDKVLSLVKADFRGLVFVNLVDFDMLFGHRNDVIGYAEALNSFDYQLSIMLKSLSRNDLLVITADHGCDPGFPGTDHTRETVPCLFYSESIKHGVNLGKRSSFADMGVTVLDALRVDHGAVKGNSFWGLIK